MQVLIANLEIIEAKIECVHYDSESLLGIVLPNAYISSSKAISITKHMHRGRGATYAFVVDWASVD